VFWWFIVFIHFKEVKTVMNFFRIIVWSSLFVLILLFVFFDSGFDYQYVIPKRLLRLGAIIVGGACVAFSAITFQTITNNRIITPSIMGYEAVYLLFQSLLILAFNASSQIVVSKHVNFILAIIIMLMYSFMLQHWLLKNGRKPVFSLLLTGLVLTMVLTSFIQLIQFSISPGEFAIFQSYSQATFNRVDASQLIIAASMTFIICLILWHQRRTFDVFSLGREQALSLGIDDHRFIKFNLGLIAILVAISTSLLGPTAFMGVFVANLAYFFANCARHSKIFFTGCVVAITSFLVAQLLVEHVFNYRITVGILVNLLCAIYFLALILRPRSL
jgi:iron complex transport system permease protein